MMRKMIVNRKNIHLIAFPLLLMSLLGLAACSNTSAPTTAVTSTSQMASVPNPTNPSTSTPGSGLVYSINTSTKAGVGTYLVDGNGMTLYWTTRDSVGQSNITGTTLANWPVFYASNIIVPSSPNASDFSSITRNDGSMQTTFKGWPLYYYVKDQAAGDTLGQGLAGVWFVVDPIASAPMPPMTMTTNPSTTISTGVSTTTATQASGTPITISLIAQNFAFNPNTITVPAGASVTINFDNKDTAPHNFALYTNSRATPPAIFQGQTITGPATISYTFTAPTTPGTYFFRCDVHPTIMTGSFIVQ